MMRSAKTSFLSGSAALGGRSAAMMVTLCLCATTAVAAPVVGGTAERAHVEANDASLDDVLAGIAHSFSVSIKSSGQLGGVVSGTFDGPLNRVIERLLAGHSYMLRQQGGRLELAIVDKRKGSPATAVAGNQAPKPAQPAASADNAQPKPVPAVTSPAESQSAGAAQPPSPAPKPEPAGHGNVPLIQLAAGPAPMPQLDPNGGMVPTIMPSQMEAPMPVPGSAAVAAPMPTPTPGMAGPPIPPSMMPKPSDAGAAPPTPTPAQPDNAPKPAK